MFEDSLFASAGKLKPSSPMTIVISFLLQSLAVGVLVLIPLVYTEALPARQIISMLMTPPPLSVKQPAAAASPAVHVASRPLRQQTEMRQPTVIPDHAVILRETPLPPIVSGSVVDQPGWDSAAPATPLGGTIIFAPPPPPPLPPREPERTQIGGDVMLARLVFQPRPGYPPLARQARIQGTVRLQALISKEGKIENLTVLGGHPLLIPAALEAVRQWRYQPTLLNGVPVEVETTIEVNFTLGR
jgi:protein TonB